MGRCKGSERPPSLSERKLGLLGISGELTHILRVHAVEGLRAVQPKALTGRGELGDKGKLLEGLLPAHQLGRLAEAAGLLASGHLLIGRRSLLLVLPRTGQLCSEVLDLIKCTHSLPAKSRCLLCHVPGDLWRAVIAWAWNNGALIDAAWNRDELLLKLNAQHLLLGLLGFVAGLLLAVSRDNLYSHGHLLLLGGIAHRLERLTQQVGWACAMNVLRKPPWR
mmetsp:Transcript_131007/g.184642  ORF Transcript_131007/g.184642 Transcript_131007/m.184642 type:complete len:222 (-) Transcript_131007:652-1317(-)